MPSEGIFGFNALGISVTLACPLECAHCITNSSPRVREEMSIDEAIGYLRAAHGAIDHVSFTGGECFLNMPRLEGLIREADGLGYIVSVMTSAYWAREKVKTVETLRRLKDLGLDMIGVSLDRFHLGFIDESRAVNVAEACAALDLKLAVRVIQAEGDDYGNRVKSLLRHTPAEVHVNYLVKLGRAEKLPLENFKRCANPPRETCETVTAVDVVPGGLVYACCGPGLYMNEKNPLVIGHARKESLATILRRALSNPFMKVINTRGPVGLLEDLQKNGLGNLVSVRKSYTDACELCLDICNNHRAVEALQNIYDNGSVRREQNALQFLKMVKEYQELGIGNRVVKPAKHPVRSSVFA